MVRPKDSEVVVISDNRKARIEARRLKREAGEAAMAKNKEMQGGDELGNGNMADKGDDDKVSESNDSSEGTHSTSTSNRTSGGPGGANTGGGSPDGSKSKYYEANRALAFKKAAEVRAHQRAEERDKKSGKFLDYDDVKKKVDKHVETKAFRDVKVLRPNQLGKDHTLVAAIWEAAGIFPTHHQFAAWWGTPSETCKSLKVAVRTRIRKRRSAFQQTMRGKY